MFEDLLIQFKAIITVIFVHVYGIVQYSND